MHGIKLFPPVGDMNCFISNVPRMPFINALPTVCPTRKVKWDIPNTRNVLTQGID